MEHWVPVYTFETETGEVCVEIPSTNCTECPVSIINRHPHIDVLVRDICAANSIKDATGAVVYGTDASKWDCRWFDATDIFARQEKEVDIASRNPQPR